MAEAAIDEAILAAGLTVTMRTSLKKYPGFVHWHARNGRESGTLEITLWPKEHRAWFSIQSGRTASWIGDTLEALSVAIRDRLHDAR